MGVRGVHVANDAGVRAPIDRVGAVAFGIGLALLLGAVIVAVGTVRPTFPSFVGSSSKDCGTIFSAFDSAESYDDYLCEEKLKGRVVWSGLLLVGSLGFLVPSVVTLRGAYRDDPMPIWVSFPLIGLPIALVLLIAFGIFYWAQFPGGD
jgi:hypothetical protein